MTDPRRAAPLDAPTKQAPPEQTPAPGPAPNPALETDPGGGPARILVVDDEPVIREILSDFLMMEGYQVAGMPNGHAALDELDRRHYQMLISDLKMPQMGGLELLAAVRERHPEVVTLMMTGFGTVETAIEAMKRGAFDYILKPFKVEEVMHTVRRALDQQRLRAENIELKSALSLYKLASMLGEQLELPPTLEMVVETVREQTSADRVGVILFPEEDVRWEGASAGGDPITEHDLTEAAVELGQPVLAIEGRAFRYLRGSDRTASVTSMLMLPLTSRGKRLGLLVAVRDGGRPFVEGQRKLLTILADRAAAAVHNVQLFQNLERTFRESIEAFVTALEEKDRYTRGHSERVAEFSEVTARAMGLDPVEVELIYQAGRLHDIGKLTVRLEDLNKPASLTDEEYERFKAHPGYGEELLSRIPAFRKLLPGIGGHHERYDGSGYPRGIAGEAIPLMARVMAVADTYDAMTSNRAYRAALEHAVAVEELRRCAGGQFDPAVVEAFCVGIEEWRQRRQEEGREYPR